MRWARLNPGTVLAGTALQLSKAIHDGKTILLDTLTGSTVTLPPATGSKAVFKFFESLSPTSNNHIIKVQNSVDVMQGSAGVTIIAGTAAQFPTTATSDTITLNKTTTGGSTRGAWFILEDVAPGLWFVRGQSNGSGVLATPFSATV